MEKENLLRENYAEVRRKITQENFDFVTVISGYEGSGKSTLALKVAGYTDPDFNGTRVAFTGDELLSLMETAPRGSSILFDEAAMGLYNRESMTATNRAITTAAMIARAKNYHLVLCIPSFWSLDAYFRDHRARCWIHVERRGESIVHVPVRQRYTKDVFWEQVIQHFFGPTRGAVWDAYEERKMAFIQKALKAARERDAPDDADDEESDALREQDMAREVAANPELWTAKGRADVDAIRLRFGISRTRAYDVARLARKERGGSG